MKMTLEMTDANGVPHTVQFVLSFNTGDERRRFITAIAAVFHLFTITSLDIVRK